MKKRGVVVGVHCGYSKTIAQITNTDYLNLAENINDTGMLQVGDITGLSKHLSRVITTTCSEAGVSFDRVSAAVISLPGLMRNSGEHPVLRGLMKQWNRRKHKPRSVIIINDGELALLMEYPDEAAIVLMGDNESYVIAKKFDGSILHAGGWGSYIPDPGSGSAIRQKVLQYLATVFDKRAPQDPLFDRISEACSLRTPYEFQNRLQQGTLDQSIIVNETIAAAQERDPIASSILETAALDLVEMLRHIAVRLPMSKRIPVLVSGRLFTEHAHYLSIVGKKIIATLPHIQIVKREFIPVSHTVQYGIELSRKSKVDSK